MATKTTMREAIVSKGPSVEIVDSPIPRAEKGQLLVKVAVSGSNPKDWKIPENSNTATNSGDDISGLVQEIGEGVIEFKPGDRVASFHVMRTAGGSFAEYAVGPAITSFRLPSQTSFEEGAAIPLAALTAAHGLYHQLRLPEPWIGAETEIPLVVYGASSAVGSYVLQFARRSNIHPIIAVAGRSQAHVEQYLDRSKGDTIIDYRDGHEEVVKNIRGVLDGKKLHCAFDAVSDKGTYLDICQVLENPGGTIVLVDPYTKFEDIPEGIFKKRARVGDLHTHLQDFGYVYSRYIGRGLEEGWFTAQPHEVVPGGLEGVESGLKNLKDGKASAIKYVFRIADTPGLQHTGPPI